MPNHVFNEITLHGVSMDCSNPLVLNAEGNVDFGVLLPLPIHFWPGSVGMEHERAFPGTMLKEATKVWGTKWNAYGEPKLTEQNGSSVITCQTAWSHPRGWICALFNTLKCEITSKWLDEGRVDAVVECWTPEDRNFLGGASWKHQPIPEGSVEHRRLHKCLWGVEAFEEDA